MALFRCQVLKQSFLVPRVSTAVVYYVHSHLQYTPSISQAVQKFDLPPNELCQHHAPNTLINDQYIRSKKRAENKVIDEIKNNAQDNGRISELEMSSSLITSFRLDPFIGQSQLALLSLCYDAHKNFRGSYHKSLDEQMSLEHWKIIPSPVADHSYNNSCHIIKSKKDNVWTVYKCKQESMPKESEAVDTPLNVKNRKDFCNKMEADTTKKSTEEKCDPLHLAVVFDFLREEIPLFFTKRHGYELYHDNVTFVNGLLGMRCSGLRAYKICISLMRMACLISMTDVTMEILKITKESKDCNIIVRWRVSGVPRFSIFRSRSKQDVRDKRYVDGISVFEVGKDGLIHCHRLMKLMPSQSPQLDNPLWALNTAAVISLLRQEKSFQFFAHQCVEDIEDAVPLFGTS